MGSRWITAMALGALGACTAVKSSLEFTIERGIPASTIQGQPLGGLLGDLSQTAFGSNLSSVDIDFQQEMAAHDTKSASSVRLQSLSLAIVDSASQERDFDWMQAVEIWVESTKSGSALPAKKVAHADPVPPGVESFAFTLDDNELLDYVNEGMRFTARGKANAPSRTVTFDGRIRIRVRPL